MLVKKYSGELVPFDESSLRQSLSSSGATEEEVNQAYLAIQDSLYDGISTKELYQLAFNSLKQRKNSYAARYSLKKAIRELGPEGFYFEQWIAKLYQEDGYQAITGQTIQGHAVTHEIDVVAVKGEEMIAIECKFRNNPEDKISVTTPMYFKSRREDISDLSYPFFNKNRKFTSGMLVTNAYLTKDSIAFGEFYKLKLLSWDYPKGDSIKNKVDNNGEYPITCLTTLTAQDKAMLLKNQCILVKDILKDVTFMDKLEIPKDKQNEILKEANELINSPLKTH